jgi:aspartokinase
MDRGEVLRNFLVLDADFVRKYEKQLRPFDKEMRVEYDLGIVILIGDRMKNTPGVASMAINSLPQVNIKQGIFAPHNSQIILVVNQVNVRMPLEIFTIS